MQIAYHYLRLRQHFADLAEGEQREVTLPQLAAIFCCTERNAKMVVRQMMGHQWLEWVPGRGRGHLSRMTFLRTVEQIALPLAQEHVGQGDLEKAMQLLQDAQIPPKARDQFFEWLSGQFGFRTEEGEKRSTDTLRIPFYRTIPALDPAFVNRRTESHMVKQIFDTLVRYDEKTGSFRPHLAHHWEMNETGMEWVFYLRKGVLFHHGRELTAHDVVWTLKRIADPRTSSPYRWMLQDIEELTTERDTILRVKMKRSNHLLLSFLASDRFSIVPGEVVRQKGGDFAREPVGSGPFRLVVNDERMLVLETFHPYFQGRAHLDRVEIWVVPETGKLQKDSSPIDGEIHLKHFPESLEPIDSWRELQQMEKGSKYLAFNLNRPGPQQNQAFRELMNSVLDRKKMIAELAGNRILPAHGFLPGDEPPVHTMPSISMEEARSLAAKCGYKGELLTLYTYVGAGNEQDAEWLVHHLREAGIAVEMVAVPIEELKKPETLRKADLLLAGEVFDAQWLLGMVEMYLSDISFMRLLWDKPLRARIDRELDRLMQERDEDRQKERLLQVESLLKERSAVLFLFHSRQTSTYHSALAGVSLTALGWVDYKDIWFRTPTSATIGRRLSNGGETANENFSL